MAGVSFAVFLTGGDYRTGETAIFTER